MEEVVDVGGDEVEDGSDAGFCKVVVVELDEGEEDDWEVAAIEVEEVGAGEVVVDGVSRPGSETQQQDKTSKIIER